MTGVEVIEEEVEVEDREEGNIHQGCQEERLVYGMHLEERQRRKKEKQERYCFSKFIFIINGLLPILCSHLHNKLKTKNFFNWHICHY